MSLIIFMRHGQAYNNVQKLLVGRNLESHLTDLGREQKLLILIKFIRVQ